MKRILALLLCILLVLTTFSGCLKKKSGTRTEDTSAYELLYAPVLKKYKQALDETWPRDKYLSAGLSPRLASLDKSAAPSFAFLDLDGDKTPELFIGRADQPAAVFDLYTTDGENIKQLLDAPQEPAVTLTDDRRLVETDNDTYESLDVTTFYELQDGNLAKTDSYIHDADAGAWYYVPGDPGIIDREEWTVIDETEYAEKISYQPGKLAMNLFADLVLSEAEDTVEEVNDPAQTEDTLPTALTQQVSFPTPTNDDLALLGTDYMDDAFLNALTSAMAPFDLYNSVDQFSFHFDSNMMTMETLKDMLFNESVSLLYTSVFGAPEIVHYDEASDPFRDANPYHYYVKYSAEKILFLAQYVLNMDLPFDWKEFNKWGMTNALTDGAYYYPYYNNDWQYLRAKIKSQQAMKNGQYKFTIEYIGLPSSVWCSVDGEGTLIATLKDVGGQHVWSVQSYDADLTTNEEEELPYESEPEFERVVRPDTTGFSTFDLGQDVFLKYDPSKVQVQNGTISAKNGSWTIETARPMGDRDLEVYAAENNFANDMDFYCPGFMQRSLSIGGYNCTCYRTVEGSTIHHTYFFDLGKTNGVSSAVFEVTAVNDAAIDDVEANVLATLYNLD